MLLTTGEEGRMGQAGVVCTAKGQRGNGPRVRVLQGDGGGAA